MKKILSVLITVIIIAGAMSGCAGNTSSSGADSSTAGAESTATTESTSQTDATSSDAAVSSTTEGSETAASDSSQAESVSSEASKNTIDAVTIYSGLSSKANITNTDTINSLLTGYNTIQIEETDQTLNSKEELRVVFSSNGTPSVTLRVDSANICWIDGKAQNYKITSDGFDYETLKSIYEANIS